MLCARRTQVCTSLRRPRPLPPSLPPREKELAACGMRAETHRFYGSSDAERQAALRRLTGPRGGVLLTTYGMVLHNAEGLARGLGGVAAGAAPSLVRAA